MIKEVQCQLEGSDCTCDWCCSDLKVIGKSKIREEVIFVPAKMYKTCTTNMLMKALLVKKMVLMSLKNLLFLDNRLLIVWCLLLS